MNRKNKMNNKLSSPPILLIISLASIAGLHHQVLSGGWPGGVQAARIDGLGARDRHRDNLFEPLYAYDDIDAHTVVAGSDGAAGSRPSPKRSLAAQQQPKFTAAAAAGETLLDSRPSLYDSDGSIELGPKVNQQQSKTTTTSTTRSSGSSTSGVYSSISPFISTLQPPQARPNPAPDQLAQLLIGGPAPSQRQQQIVSTVQSAEQAKNYTKRDEIDKPRHWSALEDYYKKLEQAYKKSSSDLNSNSNSNSDGLQASQLYYPDDHHDTKAFYPVYRGQPAAAAAAGDRLVPSIPPAGNVYYNQSQGIDAGPWTLPFGSTATTIGHHRQPPVAPYSNSDKNYNIYPEHQRPPAWAPSRDAIRDIQQAPYSPVADNQPILILARPQQQQHQFDQPLIQQQQQQQQQQLEGDNYLTLLEILNHQGQNHHRRKHQELILGPIYNSSVESSWLLEEAYCQANRVPLRDTTPVANSSSARGSFGGDSSPLKRLTEGRLLELELAGSSGARSPGQYPSHVGLYNGTGPQLDDGQFLCGATWIGQSYVLTLASCVRDAAFNQSRPARGLNLWVRTNEWRLKRQASRLEDQSRLAAQSRQVRQVHVFPKYLEGPREHNLAILELVEPLGVSPWAYPACQLRARSLLRSSAPACWSPIRSVRMEEFVDIEGEGDTKLRMNVTMLEAPIQLITSDESRCKSQTLLDHFLFNHPNYICAGDFRLAQGKWRQALNQTSALGSGIYCYENGQLNLVSLLHPIYQQQPQHQQANSPTTYGYLDLSYYGPWIRTVIYGRPY